jgi:hypothetical protein
MSHIRRRRRIIAWVIAVVGAFAFGLILSWALTSFTSVRLEGSGGGDVENPDTSFAISGDLAEPVFPGELVPLDLSFANEHGEPLLVTDLTVTVEAVDAPNATTRLPCSTEDFTVEQLDDDLELRIGAGQTRSLTDLEIDRAEWPQVGMIDTETNQDGCKAATLQLSYTASGRFES